MKRSDLFQRNVETRKRLSSEIKNLKECQEEINSLKKRENVEGFEVDKRYNQLKKPLFEKRNQLMIQACVPWSLILKFYPRFSHGPDGDHVSCLDYLNNFTLKEEDFSDPNSQIYTMYFHFKENPYFCNEVLWKKCTVDESNNQSLASSKIKWKSDYKPKAPNGSGDNSRKRKRELVVNCGFLKWLSDNKSDDSYEVADFIYSEIWQNTRDFCLKKEKVRKKNTVSVSVDVDSNDELDIESFADDEASSFEGEFEDSNMSENGYDSIASRGSWDFDGDD